MSTITSQPLRHLKALALLSIIAIQTQSLPSSSPTSSFCSSSTPIPQLPTSLTLSQYNFIMFSEAPLDFGTHDAVADDNSTTTSHNDDDELLFTTAVAHDWNHALSHNETMFPYVICNTNPELSGYQRQMRSRLALLDLTVGDADDDVDDDDNDYASSSTTVLHFSSIIYNGDDQTCFIGEAVACSIATRYYNLTQSEQQYLIVTPMMQSMKMGKGTVNKLEKQMRQPIFRRRFDDSPEDDKVDVIFAVMFCPTRIMEASMTTMSTGGGDDIIAMEMADDLTRFILSSPPNTLSSTSFFYEYVSDESLTISSTTNESQALSSTERMVMWADTLEGGVNTHNCSILLQDNITFMDQWYTSDTVTVHLSMMRENFTSVVEACVWSLIQGVALNETVCHLEALSPIEPRGGKGGGGMTVSQPSFVFGSELKNDESSVSRGRISLLLVSCTILTMMYYYR